MRRLEQKPELYLATAAKMLEAEDMSEAASLLRSAHVSVKETGYDNWDGGTRIWTVYLEISPTEYAHLGSGKEPLEEQIYKRLKPVVEKFSDDWFGVKFTPRMEAQQDWQIQSDQLSSVTRRNILDGLKINNVVWHGRLDDVEFLGRLFDLESLPSYDSR